MSNKLPALVKTWQFQVNQAVPSQTTQAATEKLFIRTVKNLFKSFGTLPWTCSGSSNSAASGLDGVDRWATDANIVKAAAGVAHSWIVLRQTGIAANYEICLDMVGAGVGSMTIVISPSAGFTGGTTLNRPTATDEIVLINNAAWMFTTANASFQIHAMQSTDGQCTRIQAWQGGQNQCFLWMFEKPENPATGWTNPSFTFVMTASAAGFAGSYVNFQAKNAKGRGSATFSMACVGEGSITFNATTNIIAGTQGVGANRDNYNSTWNMTKVGIASDDASHRGFHGTLFDFWWAPLGVTPGMSYPDGTVTAMQFMCFGNFIFPWSNNATMPRLS